MTSAHKAYVESWLDKAENDLMSAQRLLENRAANIRQCLFSLSTSHRKVSKGVFDL